MIENTTQNFLCNIKAQYILFRCRNKENDQMETNEKKKNVVSITSDKNN